MDEISDVVVVGAGAAGIAAAHTLGAAGRRVTLLEARGHAGGRAVVDTRLGVPVDLGAAWLHFAHINPFAASARQHGFTIDEREPDWGPQARVAGHRPTPAEVAAWSAAMKRYYDAIEGAAAAGRDVALTEVLPDDEHRARFDAVMTWAVGAESREISTVDLDAYAEGGPNWSVVEGLGAVVARGAHALEVRHGAVVTRIDWRGAAGVRVESTLGTLRADAVIVTIPTAVLARGAVRFDPPLPPAHRDAIDDVPLGIVNKVFFRFDDASLPPAPLFTFGRDGTSRTAHHQLRPARQPVSMSFFGGDLSRELEASGELAAFAREELRSIFGADFVAGIRGELVTAWGADEFARGSYSVARPGRAAQRAVLATPVTPRLAFAGEACSRTHFGTLVGAWESGVAAARAVLGAGAPASEQRGGRGIELP